MSVNKPQVDEKVDGQTEIISELDNIDIEMLLPTVNVSNEIAAPKEECIIEDNKLVGLYDEILQNCRQDREKVDEVLASFLDMVLNDGDASSASKEAVVNLIKVRSDTADKMSKIADLMTRIKLKDKDTFPRYLAAQNNTKVVIEGSQRELIKSLAKAQKKD